MTIKSEGFGFCLEVSSDEFEYFLKELVNMEMNQISDIDYDKGEKARIDFEDSSQLRVVPSELEDKDIHIHYVPGPDLENTDVGNELAERIENLIEDANTELSFFALSLRLDTPTSEAIREIGDFEEEIMPKGLEFEKNGNTYSIYNFPDSEDTAITVRLNNPEYETNLEEIKEQTATHINEFLESLGETYEP